MRARWIAVLPLFAAHLAHAAPGDSDETWRLIETGPSHRLWLSPSQVNDLSHLMHVQGRCGGFRDITEDSAQQFAPTPSPLVKQAMTKQTVLSEMLPKVTSDRLKATVEQLSSMQNRFYKSETGIKAAEWLRDQMQAIAKGRPDITVELVKHSYAQPSVVARIAGNGELSEEKVILGGHLDSINWERLLPTRWDRAPGADDNASGIAVILEAFTNIVESGIKPQRTIEFMGYAAEEIGLRGSGEIARKYRDANEKVAGVMQLDMVMFPNSARKITFIADNTDASLNQFTQRVLDTYVKMPWQESHCGYACSDHASWDKVGYPTVFPFEAAFKDSNHNIHTSHDTLDLLDPQFAVDFAKLAVAFLVEGAQ